MNIHRCYSAAIIQAALLTIASPVARAQDTTTDGYVTRKEYEELKDQLLAMKKELDALKKEKAVAPKRERTESQAGRDGRARREGQHSPVHPNLAHARQVTRLEREQRLHA